MPNESKKINKAASCIRTLLETESVTVPVKLIKELIKNESLDDLIVLKDMVKRSVKNDMRVGNNTSTSRRQELEVFMINNWSSIRDKEHVKSAFFDAYCKGRIKKDQRQKMQEGLINRCEASLTNEDNNTDDQDSFDF